MRGVVFHNISQGAASCVSWDIDICIDGVSTNHSSSLIPGRPATPAASTSSAAAPGTRIGAVRHLRAARAVGGTLLVTLIEDAVVV